MNEIMTNSSNISHTKNKICESSHKETPSRKTTFVHRLLQDKKYDTLSKHMIFEIRLHPGILRDWLADYTLHSNIIMPGVGLLELAAAAGLYYYQANGHSTLSTYSNSSSSATLVVLDGFTIIRPTVVADTRLRSTGLRSSCLWCTVAEDGAVDIYNEGDNESRTLCAEGSVSIFTESRANGKQSSSHHEQEPDWISLAREVHASRDLCVPLKESNALYEMLSTAGLQYGPSFRLIQAVSTAKDNKTSVCRLSIGDSSFQSSHLLPPPLMDALLQSAATLSASAISSESLVSQVPFAFDRVWIRQEAVESLWKSDWCLGHVKMLSASDKMSVFDCTIVSADGIVVAHMEGVHVRTITADLRSEAALQSTQYRRRSDDMELRSSDSDDDGGGFNFAKMASMLGSMGDTGKKQKQSRPVINKPELSRVAKAKQLRKKLERQKREKESSQNTSEKQLTNGE
jgi:hypothetical protein